MSGNYGWKIDYASSNFIENESEAIADDYVEPPYHVPTPQKSGHYWYPSNGDIPMGAVKAGVDKDGGDVFVGRAFHCGEILPAKIIPNQNLAYVAWGGEEHPKREWEVLCKGGASVIWQESAGGAVPPNALSVGTTADSERLYIGRVFHDGTLTPGKIHPSHGSCYIPYDGQELSFPSYEVLVLQ